MGALLPYFMLLMFSILNLIQNALNLFWIELLLLDLYSPTVLDFVASDESMTYSGKNRVRPLRTDQDRTRTRLEGFWKIRTSFLLIASRMS